MKMLWIKSKNDDSSFNVIEKIGMKVVKLDDLDDTDQKIEEVVKDNYDTIIISEEVAGFSQDIITKYTKAEDVKIIISPTNRI